MNPSYLETIPLQKPDDGELDTGGGGGRDLPGEGEGPLRLPKLLHSLQLALFIITVTRHTVGFIKNGTLVFLNFSAQDASISKISVPISKRRS